MSSPEVEALDRLVAEEEARAEAANQLRKIASEHPGVFDRFARHFLDLAARDDCAVALPLERTGKAEEPPVSGKDQQQANNEVPQLPPTPAILWWLDKFGKGTAGEIVDALANRIETSSKKPAAILYSTLASLEKHKKIGFKKSGKGERVYFRLGSREAAG